MHSSVRSLQFVTVKDKQIKRDFKKAGSKRLKSLSNSSREAM